MHKRKSKLIKRFTDSYKRSKTAHINTIFSRLINRRHNGKDFTVYMITNWMYGRNENHILDDVFENLMYEVDPEGIEKDKASMVAL